MNRESLKIETRAAFRHVAKPELAAIATHACAECDELRASLHPYHSDDVPAEVIDKHRWDLPLLSDEAKQYYLPAWIVRSIDDPQSDYTEALLYALDSGHGWFPAAPYSERQWRLIEAYLGFLEANVDEITLETVAKVKARLKNEP